MMLRALSPATIASLSSFCVLKPHTRVARANFKPALPHASVRSSSQAPLEAEDAKQEESTQVKEVEYIREARRPIISLNEDISKVIRKTASTFAPRSSTRTKNPAVPGTALYTIFEVQGYLSMALGALLSYNLIFPSDEPDIWRLLGMWSIWMFTIPSLRARDCSNKEKDALNYLFVGIPLINVILPIFWRSFAAVWTADFVAFFVMYTWKLDWLSSEKSG